MSNLPLRKEERLTIDGSPEWWRASAQVSSQLETWCHAAAATTEATTPKATEAATAAARRIARTPSRAFQARPSSPIYSRMLAHPRTLPTGFIAPCLPTKAEMLPSGGAWLHEFSASSLVRTVSACGSTADPATTSPAASR